MTDFAGNDYSALGKTMSMSNRCERDPLIRPARLRFGDTVGIVAPASALPDPAGVDHAVAALEKLGFKPRLARNVRRRLGFLAGSDAERAADIMQMFLDGEVKAIFCLRGGYGSGRVLRQLDYRSINKRPKIFIGYSDITALHCALLTQARLVCFHGPMLVNKLAGKGAPRFTVQSLLKTVMEPCPAGAICAGYNGKSVRVIRGGKAEGALIGGNLSLLCATSGTPYQPVFRGAILFFEDVDEAPFRFDRMLTHLLNAGVLQQVAGVAIGVNKNCRDKTANKTGEYRQSEADVMEERLRPLKVPVVAGLPFGHAPWNATLPVGLRARLDAENGDLVIMEAAVR
ncbi:MAG: S66 peptidase family protein [Verrucomicrobiia bacterium]